jgi:hypothetical protein
MKKVYNYAVLNEFFNTEATPREVKERLCEIAINYAKTCDYYSLDDMKKDISFLQSLADHIEMVIEKQGKEETV